MKKCDIGLVGLAVMGENLVMNMESKGFQVAIYNRTTQKVKDFVEGRAAGKNIVGCYSIEELVANAIATQLAGVMSTRNAYLLTFERRLCICDF